MPKTLLEYSNKLDPTAAVKEHPIGAIRDAMDYLYMVAQRSDTVFRTALGHRDAGRPKIQKELKRYLKVIRRIINVSDGELYKDAHELGRMLQSGASFRIGRDGKLSFDTKYEHVEEEETGLDNEQRKLAGIRPMRASLEEARQEALGEVSWHGGESDSKKLAAQLKKGGHRVTYDANRDRGTAKLVGFDIEFSESGNDPGVWLEVKMRKAVKVRAHDAASFLQALDRAYKEIY